MYAAEAARRNPLAVVIHTDNRCSLQVRKSPYPETAAPIRYGDGAIDYTDFCQRIMFDQTGMEALANKISARFAELR